MNKEIVNLKIQNKGLLKTKIYLILLHIFNSYKIISLYNLFPNDKQEQFISFGVFVSFIFLLNIIKMDKIYEDNESRNIFKSLIISIFIVIFTLNYLPLIINQSIVLIKELNNYLIIKY